MLFFQTRSALIYERRPYKSHDLIPRAVEDKSRDSVSRGWQLSKEPSPAFLVSPRVMQLVSSERITLAWPSIVIGSAIHFAVSISICIAALPGGRDKISIKRCPAFFSGNKGNRLTSDIVLLSACSDRYLALCGTADLNNRRLLVYGLLAVCTYAKRTFFANVSFPICPSGLQTRF